MWLKRYALCVMFCWISNFQTINYSVWRAQHFTGNLNRLVFSIFRDCVLLKKLDRSGFIWLLSRLTSSRCLVKVKKNTAKTVYEQSWSTSDPKRSWSVKIDQIENVTVKKTFAGTDQTRWKRVKLRWYFDWPIPVFIRFIEILRIYGDIYEVK